MHSTTHESQNRKPDPSLIPGNLTTDTYSGAGVTRVYDAENRMTSETQANSYLAGSYTYNADGQRVRRTVGGQPSAVTTWQVYGLGGELLAEYAANASVATPQKEYGYRNGQLLITADAPAAVTNVALERRGQACDLRFQCFPLDVLARNGYWVDSDYEVFAEHPNNSARQETRTSFEPGLHLANDDSSNLNKFYAHWDKRSTAFRESSNQYWTSWGEMKDAADTHKNPYSPSQLRQELRKNGTVPRSKP